MKPKKIETRVNEHGERISRITRIDGTVYTVVVPKDGMKKGAPEHWEREWICEGDPMPLNRFGQMNAPRNIDSLLAEILSEETA